MQSSKFFFFFFLFLFGFLLSFDFIANVLELAHVDHLLIALLAFALLSFFAEIDVDSLKSDDISQILEDVMAVFPPR